MTKKVIIEEFDLQTKETRTVEVQNTQRNPIPDPVTEARNHLAIQKAQIAQLAIAKLNNTLPEKVHDVQSAAFNLEARERSITQLRVNGVPQKELLALRRESQELASQVQKRGKEVQKEVKLQPQNDQTKKLNQTLDKALKSAEKSLGRAR